MNADCTFERLFYCLQHEVLGAESKFPGGDDNLVALSEEVGELANAMLEQKYKTKTEKTNQDVFAECIQIAAMALKIARNGDSSFPYEFTYECYRDFKATER